MKKHFWIAALILFALILITEYDLTRRSLPKRDRINNSNIENESNSNANLNRIGNKGTDISQILPEAKTKDEARQSFGNQFIAQARQIGSIQTDIETTEIELKKLSHRMQKSDIRKIADIAADTKVNGDERALAVELLSRNQTPEALKELEKFVIEHESKNSLNGGRASEFETILRAQAIEGISIYPEKHTADEILKNVDSKISESFLKDRIARGRANLAGHAPSLEEQDDAALRKLVE